MLSPARLRDTGYFDARAVGSLLERHRTRRGSFGAPLLGVLGIQLWDELFIRGHGPIEAG